MAGVLLLLTPVSLAALLAAPGTGEALRSWDPRTADPPLPHAPDAELCARVPVIVGAQLTGYYQTVRTGYAPPSNCSSGWDQVVLELTGTVRGLQFDRFGGVWLRGVEVLRITTPEPTRAGIAWRLRKDLTDYATLFEEAGEVALEIPNVVNHQYTGVLNINITFSFYRSQTAPAPERWVVMPLRNLSGAHSPVDAMGWNGPEGQTSFVSLPSGTSEALLDVYASGHACEEFWYTNSVDELADKDDCAGGAYRELLVYVDGVLAGAQYPFPVVYTGGIHPLFWRPLTGILSFDIPAYRFDLTPFLAWLTDGSRHNVTIAIYHEPPKGTWFFHGILLLNTTSERVAIGGSVDVLQQGSPEVNESFSHKSDRQSVHGKREYHVRGSLTFDSGEELRSEVKGTLAAHILNTNEISRGLLAWNSSTVRGGIRKTITAEYPFDLVMREFEEKPNYTFEQNFAHWSRRLQVSFDTRAANSEFEPSFSSAAENTIDSRVYEWVNKSGKRKHYDFDFGANESSRVWTSSGSLQQGFGPPCFKARLASVNGSLVRDDEEATNNACSWPHGVYYAGNTFCGDFTRGPGAAKTGGPAFQLEVLQLQAQDVKPLHKEELLEYPSRALPRMARRRAPPEPLFYAAPATPAAAGSSGGLVAADHSIAAVVFLVLISMFSATLAIRRCRDTQAAGCGLDQSVERRVAILERPLLQT
mmetsp:Transcript_120843/g.222189  ORF Transcript_120843/g.222189 Transcript_120843/m.222189 type:complete len:701 (+) Transcript_120843:38-2140(+)